MPGEWLEKSSYHFSLWVTHMKTSVRDNVVSKEAERREMEKHGKKKGKGGGVGGVAMPVTYFVNRSAVFQNSGVPQYT